MDTKCELTGDLTPDLLIDTAGYLPIQGVVNVAITSRQHLQLFKPIADVRKFLHHVTHGNHVAVMDMLLDISLFYRKGQVTDCSGRHFANISGFEYALWALDTHMWSCIFECVPQTEEGLGVLKLLKGQYDNLVLKGVTYTFYITYCKLRHSLLL